MRAFAARGTSLVALVMLMILTGGQNGRSQDRPAPGQVRIPNRPSQSLFTGEQGTQNTEIHFDPATATVTVKFLVQDPKGYFIPNLHPENFAVYENGMRQQDVMVEVEHAPALLGTLLEAGGHYPSLNKAVAEQSQIAFHQLLDAIGPDDQVAVWKYADQVQQLADFAQGRDRLERLIIDLQPAGVSEANLFDALVFAANRVRPLAGRKAILLFSTGVDTFSKATRQDAINALRDARTPAYAVDLGSTVRQTASLTEGSTVSRIDWKQAEANLSAIARGSGGRVYTPKITIDLAAMYDDLLENLKVRYVVRYKSSTRGDPNSPRMVRIELVDTQTGGPLRIVDASGKQVRASVIVQESYVPAKVSG